MKFKPMLTPLEMLQKGVFGGAYFRDIKNCDSIPGKFFDGVDEYLYCSQQYRSEINYFKVKAGQSYEEWRGRGWIHKDDPRGWFEWYCKFSLGRRHEDDDRQIKRWLAFCGPKGRWRNYIYSKIYYSGCDIDDVKCVYRKMQQSLLHWSYIVNEADYELWLSVKKPPQLLK